MQNSQTNKPRRKYSIAAEVRRFARQVHMAEDEWSLVPVKRVLNRIVEDLAKKNLYLYGKGDTQPVPFSYRELLEHSQYFPLPEERKCLKNKNLQVRRIPVFSRAEYKDYNFHDALQFRMKNRTCDQMIDGYYQEEHKHKTLEDHHPDGPGWVSSDDKSMEVVFDIFSSLLREMNLRAAWRTLWKILATPKFAELRVDGVYRALMHMCVRGVDPTHLATSSDWRRRSQKELYSTARQYQFWDSSDIFGMVRDNMLSYRKETNWHVAAMNSELRLIRLPGHHDMSKYSFSSSFFYSWYWGLFQQLSPVNQYRLRSEKPVPVEDAMEGTPTMYHLGKAFGDGLAKSEVLKETVKETVKETSQEVFHDARESSSEVLGEARQLLEEFHAEADTSLEKASQLVERLTGSMEGLMEMFSSMSSAFRGIFTSLSGALSSIPSISSYMPTFDRFLAILRDYIVFVNVDNALLKSMTILSLLNNLGFVGPAMAYFREFVKGLSQEVHEDGNTTTGTFTSGILGLSFTKIIYLICGTFASLVKGSSIGMKGLYSLIKSLNPIMKEVHFMGAGCVGFERIITFVSKIYNLVANWIKRNVFGIEDQLTAFAKRVTLLTLKANYFSTEAGYDAIRMNVNMREKATTVFPMYMEMITQARNDPSLQRFVRDIETVRRNCKDVHDFITRYDAVSNFVPTMFHAQFVGEPGIGKSFLMKTFVRDIQRSLYPDEKGDSVYSYNPNLEFFDGYAGQKIFIMDDCFRMQEPKHLTTLIGLITNTPVILPMANLSDKGTQLTSDVMLSSTNTPYPIGKDVLCMEAVHRRRHMLIETVIDPRVRDHSTGQFSMTLYKQFYHERDISKFPHLKFNLMRPVPREWGGACGVNVTESANEFDELQKYARKLRDVNIKIMTPGGKNIDPTYYFSEDNRPPEPISLPCVEWTYEQLVHNFAARYCAFRGAEQTFSTRRKYLHAERAISEIENLVSQAPDIVDGVEFPFKPSEYRPYQMISHLFGEVHHPYGAGDEIGKRVADYGDDVAPELDDIDFEKIAESIWSEHVPTALTLDEEFERMKTIRARSLRLKAAEPAPMRERLQVHEIDNPGGGVKTLIRVLPHFTVWEGWGIPRMPRKFKFVDRYVDSRQMEELYHHMLEGSMIPQEQQASAKSSFKKFMGSFVFGSLAYYPNFDIFGERRKKKSSFPLYFLQHLEYHRGDWHLDVSSFITEPFSAKSLTVFKGGEEYTIPLDAAALLSFCDTYRVFCLEFADLTTEQQKAMVEEAKWRNSFTGLYTFDSIKQSCKAFLKRTSFHCLEYFMAPLQLLIANFPSVLKWASLIAIFFIGVWSIRSIAQLFVGRTKQHKEQGAETSKFMHKGAPSLIRYYGAPTSVSQGTIDQAAFQAQTVLKINTRQVTITSLKDNNTILTQSLFSSQFCFVNTHSVEFLEGDEFVITIHNPSSDEVQQFVVPRRNFVKLENSDLVCIYSDKFPVFPSIRRKLITQAEHESYSYEGDFMIASRFMNTPTLEYQPFQRKAQKILMHSECGITSDINQAIILSGSTSVGKSGSPVIYISPQCAIKIVGLQAWALGLEFTPQIAVQVFTQENYDFLVSALKKKVNAIDCELTLPVEVVPLAGLPTAFTSEDYNSVVGETADQFVVGKVGKSQIQKSVIAASMEQDGYTSKRCPAIISRSDPRGRGKEHFLSHSLGKFVRGSLQPFLPDKLWMARDWTKRLFESKLDKDKFRLLEFSEIITGLRVDGSNPMNLSTSPGLPFVKDPSRGKGKTDHFHISEEGELDFIREGLLEEFENFYDTLTRSKIPYALAYDFPKDELRPRDKALGTEHSPPKTRTVVCMNMYYIMAWRYLTLDFWSSMHRAADGSFPFCPGMNPEGPDWTTAFRYLTRHPNVVDFDVSNWDGYLNSELFYAAGEVIASFLNLDPRDQRALNTIMLGVQNSYIQYERWIYLKLRGMISGFPGTAEVNTTSHIILFFYVYLLLVHGNIQYENLEAFCYHISFLVYGDDIIVSFSDEIKPLVNGKSIAAVYAEIGYPITSGSKTEEIRESKDIWHCSFLKSTWIHLHSGIYLRKMDIEIANDLLYWCRHREDPIEQFMLNSIDALRIVFCHGKETFDAFIGRLNKWLRRKKIAPILYTYQDFYRDYMYRYYIIDGSSKLVVRPSTLC